MIDETGDKPFERDGKKICPFLGLKEDPSTALSYPTIMNFCNQARPPQPPTTVHQRAFCLSAAFETCRVFISQQTGPLPKEIRAHQTSPIWYVKPWKVILAAVFVLVVAFIAWQVVAQDLITKYFMNSSLAAATTSAPAGIIPTRTPTPSDTPTRTDTITRTNTPALTNTASATPTRTPSLTRDYAKTATAACALFRGEFPGTPCP